LACAAGLAGFAASWASGWWSLCGCPNRLQSIVTPPMEALLEPQMSPLVTLMMLVTLASIVIEQ
jgi:hypothetical protein